MLRESKLIKSISHWYFGKKVLPYWVILLMDTLIVFTSAVFTYWVTNRTLIAFENRFAMLYTALLFAALSWVGAKVFKTYSGVLRYSSSIDLAKLAYANLTTLVLAVASYYLFCWTGVEWLCAIKPLEAIVAFTISTALMWASRLVVRILYDSSKDDTPAMRVLIYGALTGGVGLAQFIRTQNPKQFELAGFISHEPRIKSMKLLGVPVYTLDDDIAEVLRTEKIQAVLVSPHRINNFRQNQELQDTLINAGCKIFMAHEAKEASVQDGQLTDEQLQLHEVSVEDLLPRQEIKVDLKLVGDLLAGKRVLITGAAGSIGSEMVRQVATFKPAKMMLIDQAETPQHDIELMMTRDFPEVPCEVVVTSISRRTRMEYIFDSFRPEYVFHAAAYKHVPMMENNPSEAVMNNIYGTKVIADMSVKYGVKKFVMISTDKAVNPTNVMGCSKRICEIYVQSLARKLEKEAQKNGFSSTDVTQFVTTRFGNVLGSNGSVIPLFREQIKNGGPVTVTDERIVRFFMLIPEACKLVLEAGTKGKGGEIFVFDMGDPVKISDLAKRMIALSGAKNVEIQYTGLREGEKLYEEVLNELEGTKPSFHEKIRIASVREYDYDEVNKDIEELVDMSKRYDNMTTVKKMKEIVPEYKSNNSEYEVLDK
jgi:FlaA1/EpsC-like NDP-sugar epimerase